MSIQTFVQVVRERRAVPQTLFLYDFCMGDLISIVRDFKTASCFHIKVFAWAIRERGACTKNLVSIQLLYEELDWS